MKTPALDSGLVNASGSLHGNPLARKLTHFAELTPDDEEILDVLSASRESFPANVDIVSEGQAPRGFLLLEGMAVRYRGLRNGARQIMTFLLPGDLCDAHVFLLKAMDHSISTITPVHVAPIARDSIMNVFSYHPRISAALWCSSLQEEAMLRERIVSLGRRDARGRMAYILCELLWRHAAVGLAQGGSFRLPLTQVELGDTLGLTSVHVNRILKEFRERRMILMDHGLLTVLDVGRLQGIAGFDQDYLNLDGASEELAKFFDDLERKRRKQRPSSQKEAAATRCS